MTVRIFEMQPLTGNSADSEYQSASRPASAANLDGEKLGDTWACNNKTLSSSWLKESLLMRNIFICRESASWCAPQQTHSKLENVPTSG